MEFQNGKLTLTLHAQSPMIHFQYDQTGATLRASEVKPKLDRYLLSQLSEAEHDKSWFIGESKTALNYKLRIESPAHETKYFKKENRRGEWTFPLYYGDIGKNEECGTFILSDASLTINCYHKKLQQAIINHLENFFLCHNFGTMQGKGFGSFVVNQSTDSTKIKQALWRAPSDIKAVGPIYKMSFKEANPSFYQIFEAIETFYKLTKSGINHNGYARSALFLYMHKKHSLGNEKAMIKAKNLVDYKARSNPNSSHEHQNYSDDHPHHYVRILLGMSSTMFKNKSYSEYVKISHDTVKRFSSPIRFKIIKGTVYIYTIDLPKEGLLGEKFTFTPYDGELELSDNKQTLPVPEQFEIKDFLAFAVDYHNFLVHRDKTNFSSLAIPENELDLTNIPSGLRHIRNNVNVITKL